MPRRWGKQQTARRRGWRQAFRRSPKRGLFTEDDTRALMAADIGLSAEDAARLLAESQAVRWLAENTDALESSNAYVKLHGLPLARTPRSDPENSSLPAVSLPTVTQLENLVEPVRSGDLGSAALPED